MSSIVTDTHALIWHLFEPSRLSAKAYQAFQHATLNTNSSIHVSAITLVELAYLTEKQRLPTHYLQTIIEVIADPFTGFVLAPVDLQVAREVQLIPRTTVPDMPDRVIAATASVFDLPLVSRDRKIQQATLSIIW